MPSEFKHCDNPTTLDLYVEQARQAGILDQLSGDVKDIKEVLVGGDHRQGLIVDVDRLKRARHLSNAIFWTCFTAFVGTVIGTTATAVYAAFFVK